MTKIKRCIRNNEALNNFGKPSQKEFSVLCERLGIESDYSVGQKSRSAKRNSGHLKKKGMVIAALLVLAITAGIIAIHML